MILEFSPGNNWNPFVNTPEISDGYIVNKPACGLNNVMDLIMKNIIDSQ
jgi:hypothetical protein